MIAPRAAYATATLRAIAVAIAIAAVVDPAVQTSGAGRPRLALVTQQPASPAAARVRARLVDTLGTSHEIVGQVTSEAAAAIVIGDRYPDQPVPANLLVATVTIAPNPQPRIELVGLAAPRNVPAGTAIRVDADVEGVGAAGTSTDFTVSSGGLEVGRLSHRFTSERERWHAAVEVVPVGEPPWLLRAALAQPGQRQTQASSVAHTVVALRRSPLAVQFYEPRPSWATTFVRRALESDPRFRVESVSFSSRGVAARTLGAMALADSRLDDFDVIVAGGLERLTAADVRALDRFMRERGGAVALLPDSRVGGAAVRSLMPWPMAERLLERPDRLSTPGGAAPFDASELLLLQVAGNDGGSEVVATAADGSSIVVSAPRGRGRLLVSGALDAWRYRGTADRGFNRFWQGAVAALALAAAPPIEVLVSPSALRPLERAGVSVRLRSAVGAAPAASVDGETIRLWPEAETGVYRGAFTARKTPGRMTIEITAAGDRPQTVARDVVVQEGVEAYAGSRPPLAMLASSHRGIDVTPERLDALERFVRARVTAADVAAVRRPMRSTWWLLPFCGFLSAEWWLRRRRGRR